MGCSINQIQTGAEPNNTGEWFCVLRSLSTISYLNTQKYSLFQRKAELFTVAQRIVPYVSGQFRRIGSYIPIYRSVSDDPPGSWLSLWESCPNGTERGNVPCPGSILAVTKTADKSNPDQRHNKRLIRFQVIYFSKQVHRYCAMSKYRICLVGAKPCLRPVTP